MWQKVGVAGTCASGVKSESKTVETKRKRSQLRRDYGDRNQMLQSKKADSRRCFAYHMELYGEFRGIRFK